ncbi:MAG: T9SS type A sorting domain-containing protein [Bacteroidales bacterium]|nr:T9SS type A sorting domain-containing protein [Bacteroidales bacterium]MCF8404918.1 T9SS type A sorting domain-containing protein [Bacteroidales bacterium]
MQKIFILILILGFSITINAQTPLTVAENFSIKATDGATLDLYEILDNGQFVFIDFFAVNCGPCQVFAPDVQQSYITFGENQNEVFFMGISYTANNALIEEWDSIYGIGYPNVSGTEGGGYNVHLQYGIQSFPTLVLIAPDKNIVSQIYLPTYIPNSQAIDSMLIEHGVTPVITSVQEKPGDNLQIEVYPNPVKEFITIDFKTIDLNDLSYSIYFFNGYLEQNGFIGGMQSIIEVKSLPPGLHFLVISKNGNILKQQKFIISN